MSLGCTKSSAAGVQGTNRAWNPEKNRQGVKKQEIQKKGAREITLIVYVGGKRRKKKSNKKRWVNQSLAKVLAGKSRRESTGAC